MAKDYFGNLNSREIAVVKREKNNLIGTLSVDFKIHRELLDKTKKGQGIHYSADGKTKYTTDGEYAALTKLDKRIRELNRMSLPEFLEKHPDITKRIEKEFPGDFVEERRPSIFPLLVVVGAVAIYAFTQSVQAEAAFGITILALRLIYLSTHKREQPHLVAVKA